MINTKTVFQSLVNISECKNVQELKDTLQAAVGNIDIVHYQLLGKLNVLVFIETLKIDGLVTFAIEIPEDKKPYSLINIVESVANANPTVFNINDVPEVFAEEKDTKPCDANVILFDRDPKLKKILDTEYSLKDISVYNGLVSIKDGSTYILIEPQVHVIIDYSTYNTSTGTVKLKQYEVSKDDEELEMVREGSSSLADDLLNIVNLDVLNNEKLSELNDILGTGLNQQISQAVSHDEQSSKISGIQLMEDIMKAFDDIENDRPVLKTDLVGDIGYFKTDQVVNAEKMKDLLSGLRDVGFNSFDNQNYLLEENFKVNVPIAKFEIDSNDAVTIETQSEVTINTSVQEDIEDGLEKLSIGDNVTETIKAKVAVISLTAFDEYASNHNVIGWNLISPNTLQIKYLEEGATSSSKITEFHDMINNLSPALVNQTSDPVKFLTELNEVFNIDLVQEFLNRVNKHNIFVRENTVKIRSALLDMEKDFESLKDEINLLIDWEKMTAYASKKERIEHRVNGVRVITGIDGVEPNVVRVVSEHINGDFFIPLHILTDEQRETYVIEDYPHYIYEVPDYAFHEVYLNGHVILIEKNDL